MSKRSTLQIALFALTTTCVYSQGKPASSAEPAQVNPPAAKKSESTAPSPRTNSSATPASGSTGSAAPAGSADAQEPKIDSDTFGGLSARSIGPATMSGRVAALDAVVENGRITLYVGAGGGGLWKSVNGGTTFKPVFDKYNQSIGAVTIDRKDPKVVWVGTGESWMRNSVSVGSGVYRSTDGGDNWEFIGLKDTEHISRIVLDPRNRDTAYVCATGHAWDANEERGVFKTTDAGKSWSKVLYSDPDTGCGLMSMDPSNPDTVYASMWTFRRKPWTFNSGGPGSGLFKSTDAGKTWKKLDKGFPPGPYGRIAVAVAPSKPSTVYATVEAKDSALYRSDDGGNDWIRLSNDQQVIGRPFYFANLYVDPKDPMRVYKPATSLIVSDDGGKTFSGISGAVHSDLHAMWINPDDPDQMFVGCDGGVYTSEDRGAKWRFLENLPLSQFYHVTYDNERPYNVYGGLQDNNTWWGPSAGVSGVYNRDWRAVYGGDGFWAQPDPTDWDYIYAEYQGGHVARINRKTLETKEIKPLPLFGEKKLRNNWNSPIVVSPTQKGTLYVGSQFLFRSRDHGNSWERISPDLTTNDPEKQKQAESGGLTVDNSDAEMHTTIFTIAESPKDPNLIWVGTDDGNVQVTRDAGKSWTNVTKNVAGLPPNTWVSSIEPGHYDAAVAYATFDGHAVGDMKSYIYRTGDYGHTWQPLATPDVKGYAHIVREDLVNRDLLFAGTEFGLFISLDGGKQWAQFKGGDFPNVAVRDIAIHPRDNDVILATHGRGVWIIDNITPLRNLTPEVLAQDSTFVDGGPQVMRIPASEDPPFGNAQYVGKNPSDDAQITYYQKKRHIFGDLKFEVYDDAGRLISTIPGNNRRGLNRVAWPTRAPAPKLPAAAGLVENLFALLGPRVLPGTYTVKMINNKDTFTTKLELVPDPRSKHSMEDRKLQHATVMKLYGMLGDLTYQVDRIADTRDQARARSAKLSAGDALKARLDAFASSAEAIRGKIVATKEGGGITGEERIREQLGDLYGNVNEYEGRPTQSQIDRTDALGRELAKVIAEYEALVQRELPGVNQLLQNKKLDAIKPMTKEEWQAKQKA